MNGNKGGNIVVLIFMLICSGLGIAAFTMSFTKKCGEGFKEDSSNSNIKQAQSIKTRQEKTLDEKLNSLKVRDLKPIHKDLLKQKFEILFTDKIKKMKHDGKTDAEIKIKLTDGFKNLKNNLRSVKICPSKPCGTCVSMSIEGKTSIRCLASLNVLDEPLCSDPATFLACSIDAAGLAAEISVIIATDSTIGRVYGGLSVGALTAMVFSICS